jgi:hypothetical protein
MSDYMTMKEIGALFGTTSHKIGRELKALGWRTSEGKPSYAAFQAGLCEQRWTQDWMNYCWAWDCEKTVRLLEENGFVRTEQPEPSGRPT